MTHRLKTHPTPFGAVLSGAKTYEIRTDDRPYAVGDVLVLQEWDPATGAYTGAKVQRHVTYLTRGAWGIPDGLVVLAIREHA